MRFDKLYVVALALLFPAVASADPCPGASPFTDIDAGASFCSNTEWLKNRGVTLGCTATTYCPGDPVTRASMALFMNRLGDALIMAPSVTQASFGALTLTALSDSNTVCTTAAIPATNYPRTFSATGHVTILGSAGAATVAMQIRYSTDGGTQFTGANGLAQRVTTDSTYTANMSQPGVISLPAGAELIADIGLFSVSGSTAIASGRCHLLLRGQSRSGTSSPFDVGPQEGF